MANTSKGKRTVGGILAGLVAGTRKSGKGGKHRPAKTSAR